MTILPNLICLNLLAQIFPVQASIQLTPPYTPYLTDYTSPGAQRLNVVLRVNDPTLAEYRCKLRITIDGVGITLRTKPAFLAEAIILEGGGLPQIFQGEDLFQYFDPNNMDFTGISRREYNITGRLPEGLYRFSIEVLDYNRNTVVSNRSSSVAWMVLNDPPMLNLPFKDAKVKVPDPTFLGFSWTPRHKGAPNSAFSTAYTFRLIEVWPAERNPYDAFLSQPPLFETNTTETQLIYGPDEPAMIPGRKYAWQVQAKDTGGRDLFKNQGRSEVFAFQFGDPLGIPENFRQEAVHASALSLRWDPPIYGEMPGQYRLRYRTTEQDTWYETSTQQRWVTISDLHPNTAYNVQVRAEKGPQSGEYTTPQRMSTSEEQLSKFSCGIEGTFPKNGEPVFTTMLPVGDTFNSRKFTFVITSVKNLVGTFDGEALMAVPWFNGASVKVRFSGVRLDQNKEMVAGTYSSVYNPGSLLSQVVDELHKIGNKPKHEILDSTSVILPDHFVEGIIDSIYVTHNGKIVVIDQVGDTSVLDVKKDEKTGEVLETVVTDASGTTYSVDQNGKVTKQAGKLLPAGSTANNYSVDFKPDENQLFGFDRMMHESHTDSYEKVAIYEAEMAVSWKSVATGKSDKVTAWSDQADNLFSAVNYTTVSGELPKLRKEKGVEITITGASHEEVVSIEAYLQDTSRQDQKRLVGRLNVISYDPIIRNLVLVPLNGATVPSTVSLSGELNRIFSPAIVTWNVTSGANLEVDLGDGRLDDESSGLLSNYTQEMRKVIKAFKDRDDIHDKSYYLFFAGAGESQEKLGYMPRKKEFGFIFTENLSTEALIKTIAHELAHGAFRLEHTFETYPSLPQRTTDNLMDYNSGTRLHKYQWDLIHNPVAVWGLFEGDDEGAMKSLLTSKYVFMHDQLSTKSYASNVGTNEFTQDAVNHVDSKLYQLDTLSVKTYIYFAYIWFHSGNIHRFDQLIENSFNHAIDSIKRNLNIKSFNLLTIVNAKYDTTLANGLKTVSFREKFYPISGLKSECTKSVNDYLKSGSKKSFVNGLDAALKERADILLQKLKICEVVVPQEIVIHYKRQGRNKYRTWGEFTIVGTDYKGYILERPQGDNATRLEDCKRHPAGTYDIVYSTSATGAAEKFWNVTMCLKEHTAYKLHGGTRADNSDGCFLINYYSPQFDKYSEAFQANEQDVCIRPSSKRRLNSDKYKYAIANTYYPHYAENNPAYKLKKYIETKEAEIKEKYKVEEVVKKIIIDEQHEKIDP